MAETPTVAMWAGTPIEECNREQLLAAILFLADEVKSLERQRECPTCSLLCRHERPGR